MATQLFGVSATRSLNIRLNDPVAVSQRPLDISGKANDIVRLSAGSASTASRLLDADMQGQPQTIRDAVERTVAARLRDSEAFRVTSGESPVAEGAAIRRFEAVLRRAPLVPNLENLTARQRLDVYSSFVEAHGNPQARQDLRDGRTVIVGLRHATSTTANNGQGLFDDRIATINRTGDGRIEVFSANTEPSAQYDHRAGDYAQGGRGAARREAAAGYENVIERYNRNGTRKVDGQDANGDGIPELGRLETGNYRYQRSTAANGGQHNGDGIRHILRPMASNAVQRDSNGDMQFNSRDTGTANLHDDATMYFHPSGNDSNTFSAGCQTFRSSDWIGFGDLLANSSNFNMY